ncbi:MAG TPA: RsmG family class I SAM-dependent methyltransferase, partial [Thermoleophilaceae bacterium]|nr:RsmG family class I SAM-dependent methyltransferase [Thermoleophilaceae bacterium]
PVAAADAHLADALSALVLDEVRGARTIADIGSGAGFPGLALAAALPDAQVDLIEASRRKCEVVERLAREAGLTGARAVPERTETWAAGPGRAAYELVTARAVGSLAILAEYAAPLLSLGGVLIAWKGRRDAEEEAAAAAASVKLGMERRGVRRVEPFPGARDRHLHLLVKHRETPAGFPRRPGRAAKRPLA